MTTAYRKPTILCLGAAEVLTRGGFGNRPELRTGPTSISLLDL